MQGRAKTHHCAGLRGAVQQADRAAHPRSQGVQPRSAVPRAAARDPGAHSIPRAIIFQRRPGSVYAPGSPLPDRGIFELGVPVLGICYGVQLMGHLLGGQRRTPRTANTATRHLTIEDRRALRRLAAQAPVWNSHGDKLTETAAGLPRHRHDRELALRRHRGCETPAVRHPVSPGGVSHRARRRHDPRTFSGICRAKQDWTMKDFICDAPSRRFARRSAPRVLGLSGGVDSSVAAALIHKAIGKQLTCVFVDNGLLRKGERGIRAALFGPLSHRSAGRRCLETLSSPARGRDRPREKRKIIGQLSSRCLKKKPARSATRVSGAGDALPGRDRERFATATVRDDQDATTTSAASRSA